MGVSLSHLKFANSLLLFAKGLGWLTSLATPGVERQRSSSQASIGSGGAGAGAGGRRMSMEEYDKPNIRGGGSNAVLLLRSLQIGILSRIAQVNISMVEMSSPDIALHSILTIYRFSGAT